MCLVVLVFTSESFTLVTMIPSKEAMTVIISICTKFALRMDPHSSFYGSIMWCVAQTSHKLSHFFYQGSKPCFGLELCILDILFSFEMGFSSVRLALERCCLAFST